jgi:hypothetical protein
MQAYVLGARLCVRCTPIYEVHAVYEVQPISEVHEIDAYM